GDFMRTVEGIRFAKEDSDEIIVDDNFKEMLKNPQFYEFLSELVDYSLEYYKNNYASEDGSPFFLYKRYSYADVCRLLNWSKSENPQRIGGYLHDKTTNTLPIFVNYHKDDSISSSIKYEDTFISHNMMSWISKSKRKLTSSELQPILKQADSKTQIELFVRKNNSSVKISEQDSGKNKDAFKEFYYLGRVNYVQESAKEIIMKDKNEKNISAVQLHLRLQEPVRDDIFDYIVRK
ncbi:MAG: DUF3427 domain-containing protein, partial [Succinivibrio sp.]|nr:DUF3427 domain-containing protein [Succinivibrio sp.]